MERFIVIFMIVITAAGARDIMSFDITPFDPLPMEIDEYADVIVGNSTTTPKSVFDRYTFSELLAVHGKTALQVDRVVTPLWYAIGYVGNTLAAVVWLQRRMRTNNSSAVYLVALSISDLLFLILHLIQELYYAWSVPSLDYPYICETYFLFSLMTQYLSPMLVLGFTVERYIAICHPFQKERLCRTARARKVVLGLTVTCCLLAAIQAYFWTYDRERTECRQRPEALALWSVWSWISELIVFLAVPLVILVFNVLVINELRRIERCSSVSALSSVSTAACGISGRTGSAFKQTSSNAAATTAMLLSVSFYVIVSTLPATLVYVLEEKFQHGPENMTDVEISKDHSWQLYFQYITVRKVVEEICLSHYACNFFLYLATGQQFRRTLIDLILRRNNRHRKLNADLPPLHKHAPTEINRFSPKSNANGRKLAAAESGRQQPPAVSRRTSEVLQRTSYTELRPENVVNADCHSVTDNSADFNV